MQKRIKICLAASAGGHLSQLLKLANSWKEYDTFCITTSDVVRGKLQKFGRIYVVGECNRQHPVRVMKVLLRCVKIVLREKPHVVISTGAALGLLVCLVAKLLFAKVVWIDSIANIRRLSLSGQLIRPVANLFLVQWPDLVEKYRNVECIGAVI